MSKTPPAFLSFERNLHRDFLEHARKDMEKLGVEVPTSPKRPRGRRCRDEIHPEEKRAVATILEPKDHAALRESAKADHRTIADYLRQLVRRDNAINADRKAAAPNVTPFHPSPTGR